MYDQSVFGIPRRDFLKLPCKRCKLKTEHVKVSIRNGTVRYVCLRCGRSLSQMELDFEFTKEELLTLSEDDRAPVGVA